LLEKGSLEEGLLEKRSLEQGSLEKGSLKEGSLKIFEEIFCAGWGVSRAKIQHFQLG
jgi:hypothetical protein